MSDSSGCLGTFLGGALTLIVLFCVIIGVFSLIFD